MKIKVPNIELVKCLSKTLDLISPIIANHHRYVASIAYQIAKELNCPKLTQKEIAFAASLHDVGVLSPSELTDLIELDKDNNNCHAERGYLLLKTYKPFEKMSKYVRYHHVHWNNGHNIGKDEAVPFEAFILCLADKIALSIDHTTYILYQVDRICRYVLEHNGFIFHPDTVQAFLELAKKESFWLDIINCPLLEYPDVVFTDELLEENNNFDLVKLFSRIIDFRSHYTSTHSSKVAIAAKTIASLAGFSEMDCLKMEIAGYIHDLGKIVVPKEILEKPGKLTIDEYAIMRSHTYYTNLILSNIKEFDEIRIWGSLHHEKLNGEGYPFHYHDHQIPLGSRIMGVADVFVALFEERPYRKALEKPQVVSILESMVIDCSLDKEVVNLVKQHYEFISEKCYEAERITQVLFDDFNF